MINKEKDYYPGTDIPKRYCKKCGKPLSKDNKRNYCEDCRTNVLGLITFMLVSLITTIGGSIALFLKKFYNRK